VCNANVEFVESFVYLGSAQHRNVSSDTEIRRRIGIARDCITQLYSHIWKSSISLSTKVRLYMVYILPVIQYCCDTWTVTKQLSDAFDMWWQRRILRIPYTRHVTNAEMRSTTGCSAASKLVRMRRLELFGHLARRSYEEDHHRVVVAAMSNPPAIWRRPRGRPRDTWLKTVSRDVPTSAPAFTRPGVSLQIAGSGVKSSTPLCSNRSLPTKRRSISLTQLLVTF